MTLTPSIYVIAYDLYKPGQAYDRLAEKIKTIPTWCRILRSTWIVKTPFTSQEIFNLVQPALDPNDRIFISKIDLATSEWFLDSSIASYINELTNSI